RLSMEINCTVPTGPDLFICTYSWGVAFGSPQAFGLLSACSALILNQKPRRAERKSLRRFLCSRWYQAPAQTNRCKKVNCTVPTGPHLFICTYSWGVAFGSPQAFGL